MILINVLTISRQVQYQNLTENNFRCCCCFHTLTIKQSRIIIKTLIPLLILLFLFHETNSQSISISSGARAMGMANASSCLADEWSLFNNVGGLATVDQPAAVFTYQSFPDFQDFDRMTAIISIPFAVGTSSLGVYRFGSDLYNEHIISAGYANRFGIASLGVKVNYIQYRAEGFGKADAFTISFGGIAQLTDVLSVGAHINNINQPVISKDTRERVPTYLTLGLGFKISEKVLVISEVEKDLDHDPVLRSGLEYRIHKKFVARMGINLNPGGIFGGFGFVYKKFLLDYALQYHEAIGLSHQASVTWKLKNKK
jgi:hypothetical protein